jgi:hypothetical protein
VRCQARAVFRQPLSLCAAPAEPHLPQHGARRQRGAPCASQR